MVAAVFTCCSGAGGVAIDPAKPAISNVREVGALTFIPAVRSRDGGFSALFGESSVWVFGDTPLEITAADGQTWRSSTWASTTNLNAADGLAVLTEPVDEQDAPLEFLPFTDAELAFNLEHNRPELPDDHYERWALWPGPIVVDPQTGRALVFYNKLRAGYGDFNFSSVGYSIATWENPQQAVQRPEVAPEAAEPTLLFPAGDVVMGHGALTEEDWLYAYGCQPKELSWPCIIGRVHIADALDRDAWEFYANDGAWLPDYREATEIMQAAPMLSVHWNDYLGKYLAIYSKPLVNSILYRTADAPEGPWSVPRKVVDGLEPRSGSWNYCGLGHAELAREGGRIEYISYYRPTGFLAGEIRLVEATFE